MTIKLHKYAKRGADKLMGNWVESSASRGTVHGNDETNLRLSFGHSYDKEGRFDVTGPESDVREWVKNIAFQIVSFHPDFDTYIDNPGGGMRQAHPGKYGIKARKPYAAAWLRALADELDTEAKE